MGYPDTIPARVRIGTTATPTQVVTAPWRERRRYILKKLTLINETDEPCVVMFYDDDTADTSNTAPQRGNGTTDPVYAVLLDGDGEGSISSKILTEKEIPFTFFQGGMVAQVVNADLGSPGIFVFAEFKED